MNDIAISIKNVSKYYKLYNSPQDRLKEALSLSNKKYHKKFYATNNLNLEIKKGEILGIVGKNGSGKSTLLKLITGVLTPDEGSIKVSGKISALLELGSGFNPEFTGIQNIFFYGTILGFTKKEMEEKLDDIIAFADIGDFIYQPIKTYSSGMKSRLGFAVAIHIEPEILILDEVLSVGDTLFKRKCYGKMEEFFKSGKTILYVSHDANSVNELCSRAVFLHEGKILLDSDPNTVTKYYQKYIFAKEENKKKIKEEISTIIHTADLNKPKQQLSTEAKSSKKQAAYYIPEFKPESTVIYRDHDVSIDNIRIETLEGKAVNVLNQDETYQYCYTLSFGINANDVSFGAQIKSEKGMQISGATLHHADKCIDVKKSDRFNVTYTFTCRLLQGTYYTNTGVSATINSERVFLTRVVDALVFKVLKKENSLCSGLVHLDQTIKYRKI